MDMLTVGEPPNPAMPMLKSGMRFAAPAMPVMTALTALPARPTVSMMSPAISQPFIRGTFPW